MSIRTMLLAACLLTPALASAQTPPARDVHGDSLPEGVLARLGTVRWRHGAAISFVGLLPDGKHLVSDSHDGTLRLWDVATGVEVRRFVKEAKASAGPNPFPFLALLRSAGDGAALAPDGRLLAAGAPDGTITLWHVATGRVARSFKHGAKPFVALLFTPDGELLIAKDAEGTLQVWDVTRGALLRTLGGQGDDESRALGIGGLTGAPIVLNGGDTIGAIGILLNDGMIRTELRRWDLVTGRALPPVRLEAGMEFLGFGFSPDGKLLVNAGFDGTVRLLDLAIGKAVRSLDGLKGNSFASQFAFTPDGKTLAGWSSDQTIHLWDVASGKELHRLGAPAGNRFMGVFYFNGTTPSNMVFSADGKHLTLGMSTGSIRRWDVESGKELTHEPAHWAAVVSLHSDGKTAVTRGADRALHTWDLATGKSLQRTALPSDTTVFTFAPDGRTAALGAPEGVLRLWDVAAGKEIRQWKTGSTGFADLAFTPDGKALAARGFDRVVHFYDSATGQTLRSLSAALPSDAAEGNDVTRAFFGSAVTNMRFSADGAVLALVPPEESLQRRLNGGGRPRPATLRLLDVATGKIFATGAEQPSGMTALAFAPDGRTLATAQGDGSLLVWEAQTGQVRLRIQRPTPGTTWTALAYAPESRALAAGGPQGTIHFFDTVTGRTLGTLAGHQGGVQSLAFHAAGDRLLSGSADTSALLWDVKGLVRSAATPPVALQDGEIEELWHALSGSDPARAHPAAVKLIAHPNLAVPLLRARLQPVPAADAEKIARLLNDLEGRDFGTRQRAAADLEKLGELIEPALKEALAAQPGLERRQRLEQVYERLAAAAAQPPAERLQASRAIEVLDRIGTPDAVDVLRHLAGGAPASRLTRQAKEAAEKPRLADR